MVSPGATLIWSEYPVICIVRLPVARDDYRSLVLGQFNRGQEDIALDERVARVEVLENINIERSIFLQGENMV